MKNRLKKLFQTMYIKEKKTLLQMAKELKISTYAVANIMEIFHIKRRNAGESCLRNDPYWQYILTKSVLKKLYWNERKCLKEIADTFKVSASRIGDYMKKYNIPRRTVMEANKIRPTYDEKKVLKILTKLVPNKYKYVGDKSFYIGKFNPDFIDKENKKIIEVFGNPLFHEDIAEDGKTITRDKRRRATYKAKRYRYLIIKTYDLTPQQIENKILKFERK